MVLLSCPTTPPGEPVVEPPPQERPQEPPVAETPPPSRQMEGYVVSEEVYNATFKEIEELIHKLNHIIQTGQFSVWRTYLTEEYVQKYSDPNYLWEISQTPILRRRGVRLTNLRHYFDEVVVMSRANAKLDKIVFLDDNRVTAYSEIQGEMTILYQLIRIGNQWKITVW